MKLKGRKLTAYLLGEVKNAEDCRAIEAAISGDPAFQKEADVLRELQSNLEEAFAGECHEEIEFPTFPKAQPPQVHYYDTNTLAFHWLPWVASVAASLVLIGCLVILNSELPSPRIEERVPISSMSIGQGLVISHPRDKTSTTQNHSGVIEISGDSIHSPIDGSLQNWNPWTGYSGRPVGGSMFTDSWMDPVSEIPFFASEGGLGRVKLFLNQGQLPARNEVQIDSLVNAFSYGYEPALTLEEPFAIHLEQARSPWVSGHTLLRIGVKGYEWPEEPVYNNLVFLVDVSGSMDELSKLPLVRAGIRKLIKELGPDDRMAIVTYGQKSTVVLPSTSIASKSRIQESLSELIPGERTRASAGIYEAYRIAEASFLKGGNNQIIVCTDGDVTLGTKDAESLSRLVERRATNGLSLSAIGFSVDEEKKQNLVTIADRGSGRVAYVDSPMDLESEFVGKIAGTSMAIARDVKLEVEFNPKKIDAYRLIGYDGVSEGTGETGEDIPTNREVAAGHSVTALYELIPTEQNRDANSVGNEIAGRVDFSDPDEFTELVAVRVHYQPEDRRREELIEVYFSEEALPFEGTSSDFRFAAAVTGFGQLLRNSPYRGDVTYDWILSTAQSALGHNEGGSRSSFVEMVRQAEAITNSDSSAAMD